MLFRSSMGGTLDSPGNVFAESIGTEVAPRAEWNFYLDPAAVNEVLSVGMPVTLVPLDATKEAAIKLSLVSKLKECSRTEALDLVHEIITSVENWISEGHYFAWDVVTAVLLVHPTIGTCASEQVLIETQGFESGRMYRSRSGCEVTCFSTVDISLFEQLVVEGLSNATH